MTEQNEQDYEEHPTDATEGVQHELQRIKTTVKNSYTAFKDNYDRFNEFRKFVFESSLTPADVAFLDDLQLPQLEFNVIEAYISRLLGEFYKQQPAISVGGEGAQGTSPEVIQFVEDHLRHIMFDNKNEPDRYEVMKDLYSGGFGVFKVSTVFKNEKSFDEDIRVSRVDPTFVGWDATARHPSKKDGRFCFELFPMSVQDFRQQFPNEDVDRFKFIHSFSSFNWTYLDGNEEIILVCDYYERKTKRIPITQLTNGQVVTPEEYAQMEEKWEKEGIIEQIPKPTRKVRMANVNVICRYRCMDSRVLEYEETKFPEFPLIFVDGNSVMLRQNNASGATYQFTRPYAYHAKGTQRLKNYAGISLANSLEDMVQHKFMVAEEALPTDPEWREAYRDVQKPSVMVFNAFSDKDPDKPIPNPIREVQKIPAPPEIMQSFSTSDGTIQNILGSYDAALGINNNQLSGVAITEAATQSNAAAMPYLVGYLHGWQAVAEIVLKLIPQCYVSPRHVPIMNKKGERSYVQVGAQTPLEMNFDKEILEVRIEAGVSYQIEKSRALNQIIGLMQASPLFAQFINEKGLPVLLDNLEIRGIDLLRDEVDQWMQEMQVQKQQQMAAQQQQMQNNPQVVRNQIEMEKLGIERQKVENDAQNDMARLLIDKEKILQEENEAIMKAREAQENSEVQMMKANAEKFSKEADIELKAMQHHHDVAKYFTDMVMNAKNEREE